MTEVLFVGTGDAFGSGGRRNTAILIRVEGQTLLLDCGPSTLAGLKQLEIDPGEIDAIVITHFHGDHVGGIPFLLLDYLFETQRDRPLEIVGPPGIEEWVDLLARAFAYESIRECGFGVSYREYSCGETLRTAGFAITPLPAYHTPSTSPHMIRVRAGGRTIVFTGDTGWSDDLPDQVGDADLFISECQFLENEHFAFHMSHAKLAAVRDRLRAARVVLTHLGAEVLESLDRVEFETAYDGLKIEL